MKTSLSMRLLTTLVSTVVLFLALSFVKPILWPFILAILLAYILDPVTAWVERLGFGRGGASFIVVTLFTAVVGVFLSILLPILINQMIAVIEKIPYALDVLHTRLLAIEINIPNWQGVKKNILATVQNVDTGSLRVIGDNVQSIIDKVSGVANNAFLFVLVLIMMFYLLKDWDSLRNTLIKIIPFRHRVDAIEWMSSIDKSVAGFLRGQLTVMIILGAWYAVVLSLIGLENGIAIGVLTGVVVFIPYVGAFIGVCMATLFGLVQFADIWYLLAIWGVYAFAQTIESIVLTPNIVGGNVGLHPVWIMFALMSGAVLFGFIGVLLAVPTAAAIGASCRFLFSKYLDSEFYKGTQ